MLYSCFTHALLLNFTTGGRGDKKAQHSASQNHETPPHGAKAGEERGAQVRKKINIKIKNNNQNHETPPLRMEQKQQKCEVRR